MVTHQLEDRYTESIVASALGSPAFRADHGVRLAYAAGSMYKGVASVSSVVRMGRAGLLSYLGAGGLQMDVLAASVDEIQRALGPAGPYGVNLLAAPGDPARERRIVDFLLDRAVPRVEAAAYVQLSPELVRYRLAGVRRTPDGRVVTRNHVLAKVSRPEVALQFLSPAPGDMVDALVRAGDVSAEAAALAARLPVADDLCAEADSGGHTDQRQSSTLVPDMVRLAQRARAEHGYDHQVRVGAAGGLGTPESIAAAFILGADFVLTGSINQCTVESGTSDEVKDLLAAAEIQDTAIVPAGDMFEVGAKVQVLRKGLLFPGRAAKLYDLYRQHDRLEDLDVRSAQQVERFFGRSFAQVWDETREYYSRHRPADITRAEQVPKFRMALIFKWYFVQATRYAMQGNADRRVDYQIQCGPAMGAFNRYVRGTDLEPWRNRHVDEIGERLMNGAAEVLSARMSGLLAASRLATRATEGTLP
ncbi:hypothetical protein GCM10022251_54070 [Phytohabitans flavus]|uniref:[Acyl-carrier-protein] S-malonyltransferase-like inserted helical domain-containing protein n=1 Tax=Phytohabitans flavus TaxID=1076124 RepID=A0A6F8XM37_9ACTN|nr:PfaD family polyunsaturated fatty acid/polyketide biosynthesis protein [Phytohabitans flavus]BCB74876.1 hypothetical protein Pflav_012860 [Phytohabitans flavus]